MIIALAGQSELIHAMPQPRPAQDTMLGELLDL
jgi:hypothetical protein